MIKKSPACCVMQRFCRCYSEILWVNNIVANKLAYSVHYFSDMVFSAIFYFLWQRKNSSCRLKSLKIWIAYISLCWRKTYFLFRRICIRKCNQQPTLKFKDDRRSVTTEEIWVNRMARKQNEALLSSDPRGVTWWQLYTRRPLNTCSSE